MKSHLFYSSTYQQIEESIKAFLQSQAGQLTPYTSSPRAMGDSLQELLAQSFQEVLGEVCQEYSSAFSRRAMADIAFKDNNDLYYVVDVKTHRKEEGFHMPNLTSVERLARFYEDDNNYFVILAISYTIQHHQVVVEQVHFLPIEFLSWKCLTIGALGWGQIQIANFDHLVIVEQNSRRKWMLELCERLFTFYPKEIEKINSRINHFEKVYALWQAKPE
jgi:hypothetical protein